VGYRFSLVLSREVTDEESEILQKAGCTSAVFGTDTLPTNAEVTVSKMDFDDTVSETLAEAIEAALEAVKNVTDLSVPGLEVPAQPATREDQEKLNGQELDKAPAGISSVTPGEVIKEVTEEKSAEPAAAAEEKPNGTSKKKPSTRKTAAKKTVAKNTADTGPEKASIDS
jgi:hypothetical protein